MTKNPSRFTTFSNSTAIKSAAYSPTKRTLTLQFSKGATYRYRNVPPVLYGGLCSAASAGQFARIYLLGKFPTQRVVSK